MLSYCQWPYAKALASADDTGAAIGAVVSEISRNTGGAHTVSDYTALYCGSRILGGKLIAVVSKDRRSILLSDNYGWIKTSYYKS